MSMEAKSLSSEPKWNLTIGDMLDQIVAQYPDTDALVYVDRNLRYTYQEFHRLVSQAAKGLMKMGVKKGDHIAIWATNYPEWIISQFATGKMGAVLVTVNTNYKQFELEYILKQSDSTTLLLIDGWRDTDYVEVINGICPELKNSKPGELKNETLPFLKNIVYIGKDDRRPEGMFTWQDLLELGNEVTEEELRARQASLQPDDVINMQYTSGTTGFPKGVMLTHNNIVNNGKGIGDCMSFTEKDKLCITVPLFHCFGCVLGTMAAVTHGTTMVPCEYFDAGMVLNTVHQEKCTALHGVPTMFIAELAHPDFDKFDLSSLRTGIMAGSPCPIEVMKQVVDKMNMKEITITYGQTEASPGITMTKTDDPLDLRVSTVGRVMPNIEAKIVDPETGEDLPAGTQGEIVARGYNIMRGYYKMPEATAAAIDADGWLHTGDLGVIDENGYFKITGRVKDMIIRGGENIYPREIEEFLYTNPIVKDVQVVGLPSVKYGEEVMAAIILKEGVNVTEEDIKEFCQGKIARYKIPKFILFVDEFPMTASGKIQKFKLREIGIEKYGLEKAAKIETA